MNPQGFAAGKQPRGQLSESNRKPKLNQNLNHFQQLAQINQSLSIRNQSNQHAKHHSYTGPGNYLNIQQVMNTVNAANGNYQKYLDPAANPSGANITAEEIAALYSNVLATQTIINGKRQGGGTAKKGEGKFY